MPRIPCPECHTPMDTSSPRADGGYSCSRCGFTLTPVEDAAGGQAAAGPGLPPSSGLPEEWELLEELGHGGMGVVHRARHRLTEEVVALKAVTTAHAADPEYGRRFAREVKVLHRLNHPNVVRLLHSGLHQGRPWLAMELVEGRTLHELIRPGPMPVAQAMELAYQVACALEYTHELGVIHRDLKPENVLVAQGVAKVTDFGLAALRDPDVVSSRLTREGATLGTFDYMAPEQRGQAATAGPAADLFALGVVLFEMLTGRLPHGAERPGMSVAGVPPALDLLAARLLERVPEDRPTSTEVRRQLEQLRASANSPHPCPPREEEDWVGAGAPAAQQKRAQPPRPVADLTFEEDRTALTETDPGPSTPEPRRGLVSRLLFPEWTPARTFIGVLLLCVVGLSALWRSARQPPTPPEQLRSTSSAVHRVGSTSSGAQATRMTPRAGLPPASSHPLGPDASSKDRGVAAPEKAASAAVARPGPPADAVAPPAPVVQQQPSAFANQRQWPWSSRRQAFVEVPGLASSMRIDPPGREPTSKSGPQPATAPRPTRTQARDPDLTYVFSSMQAEEAMKEERWGDAFKHLLEARKARPEQFSTQLYLGRVTEKLGRLEEAARFYAEARKLDPKDREVQTFFRNHPRLRSR